jgi:5-methylthioadenosine/S-adenosylhomocysteine deaminase
MAEDLQLLAVSGDETKSDSDRVLIAGGRVVRPHAAGVRVETMDVMIEGGRIVALEPGLSAGEDVLRLDARGRYVMPGLINSHTHAHNHLSRSSGDNWTLEQLRTRGSALYGGRDPEEQYLSAALGAIEMLKTGCTAAYDQFAALPSLTADGVDAVARAYRDVGIRAVLAPSISDLPSHRTMPGFAESLPEDLRRRVEGAGRPPAADLLELSEGAAERWHGAAGGRLSVGLAPVIPGLCSDELLEGCAKLTRERGLSAQTHLAESKVQAISARRRWGKSVVAHLDDVGLLGPGLVAGHAVWVDGDDISRLAESGCSVCHNPASNLKLGNGVAPVVELLEAGVTVGLGSDGCHSSDNQNMFEAMRLAALVGKNRFPYRTESWVGAAEAWRMATEGGARLLGLAGEIGVIRAGARADLALLRADSPGMTPANDLLNLLVYSQSGADVEHVFVDGHQVVADGRLTTLDEDLILARAERAAEAGRGRSREAWELVERLDPYLNSTCRELAAESLGFDRFGAGTCSTTSIERKRA